MNDNKSYVAMGHLLCPVCGKDWNDHILINTKLKEVFLSHGSVTVGLEPCNECVKEINKQYEDGYILAIEINKNPSELEHGDKIEIPSSFYVEREFFKTLIGDDNVSNHKYVYVDIGFEKKLRKILDNYNQLSQDNI